MKIKLGKKNIPIVLMLLIIITSIAYLTYHFLTLPEQMVRYNFHGVDLVFRDDLRDAKIIPVYPDEESIMNKIWDPDIYNVNLVFANSSKIDYDTLAVNGFEVRFKLGVAYNQFDWQNTFTTTELESLDNITSSSDTLTIALVSPSFANETAVRMEDNVVYIKGTTNKTFDLAIIKFLMSALNITVG